MSVTEFTLAAGPTGLERLATALTRLRDTHGFQPCPEDGAMPAQGSALLLLTADPQFYPEVLDALVILPEALKDVSPRPACLVADPDTSTRLGPGLGAPRAPAVVFFRDGQYLGSLNGLKDWAEYRSEVTRLLAGAVQPKPISIPVVSGA